MSTNPVVQFVEMVRAAAANQPAAPELTPEQAAYVAGHSTARQRALDLVLRFKADCLANGDLETAAALNRLAQQIGAIKYD